jgi:dolichyl-diphosphooligosaccharide--protein glycosyltransferase
LCLLAFGVRALPFRGVFVGGDVLPFGNDAWYHLRRIVYSLAHFPAVLHFDPYINFPDGAQPIWPPLFDWGMALLLLPFFGGGDLASVERVAVWVPPALGAATVACLYAVALRHLGRAPALVAAALLAVLPAHFWYSQIGFVDHHVAVGLVSTLLLGAAMESVAERPGRSPRALRPDSLASGACLALALLVWPGSLLHVALAEAGLALHALTRPGAESAAEAAGRFAAAQFVACVLVLPFGAGAHWPLWGDASPLVLSRFQPWLFGLLGLAGVACAALWRRPALGASPARRAASGLGLCAGLAGLALALEPTLLRGLSDAWRWLAREEVFQASVGESKPLFEEWGRVGVGRAVERLSLFVLIFPLAWAWALAWAWRRPERAPLLLWLGWSAGLYAATLAQRRFFDSFSVALALLMSLCLCQAWRALRARLAAGPAPGALAGLAVGAAAFALLLPIWKTYAPHLADELHPAGAPRALSPQLATRIALVEMARWLRLRTPPTRGWLDPSRRPEYGILAPWDDGHAIEYLARRPTLTDNFGDDIGERNFRLAALYWKSPEREASAILDRLGARYVVTALKQAIAAGGAPGSVSAALHGLGGGLPGKLAAEEPPALERHRLVYESRALGNEPVAGPALFRVFEHVAGASLGGLAAPGSWVAASVRLTSNRGRSFEWRAQAKADAQGRWSLRVPYANAGGPPAVRVGPHYELACRSERAQLVVPEAAVRSGAALEAPPLCLAPLPRAPLL